jgi:ADP-ribose pyrophosphatase YjhB (NUDIX family)
MNKNAHEKKFDEIATSVGIICIKLDESIHDKFINNIKNISYYDVNNFIIDNIHKFNQYNNLIKFLLVRRRNSLNYIDFIRGKYDIQNIDNINTMFSYMSKDEIDLIKTKDFNYLWSNLWKKNAFKKKYLEEMNLSKIKFNHLKITGKLNNINSEYDTTEWEIPKGKKKTNETNLNCAIREFCEETSYDNNKYIIINCIDPIHDIFMGTNNKEYRHIFYTALVNSDINDQIEYSNNEIDIVKWCNWEEINNIIRPYSKSKLNILTSVFLFILNICENNNDYNNDYNLKVCHL